MDRTTSLSRRTLTKAFAGAGAMALVAGCMERGPGEENGEEEGPIDDEEPAEEIDDEEWEDVEAFTLEADARGWVGSEPEFIDGLENPELVLFAGQNYDFTLINEDDVEHTFALVDDDPEEGEPVDDYETDAVGDEGESWTLEDVEASEEMTYYVCEIHPDAMYAEIDVRS